MNLFNTIYTAEIIPRKMLSSTFKRAPKKLNAEDWRDYRTIILLKIIQPWIYSKLELNISGTQFGFRNCVGTREILFSFKVLTRRCLDVNRDLYVRFITWPTYRWTRLTIISNLYYNQRARVNIGVWQDYISSFSHLMLTREW